MPLKDTVRCPEAGPSLPAPSGGVWGDCLSWLAAREVKHKDLSSEPASSRRKRFLDSSPTSWEFPRFPLPTPHTKTTRF